MISNKIPYQELRYFSKIIKAYLKESSEVQDLYNRFPRIENFKDQLSEKSQQESLADTRKVLSRVISQQYSEIDSIAAVNENITLLKEENTFTVVTGHQLNLFTGPLYFLYKIISTINLCKALKSEYQDYDFVPVYWMATEDHDFDEIKFFNFGDHKLVYERESAGAVGRLDTDGLENINEQLNILLGASRFAEELSNLFANSYNAENLAIATRKLAHELFKDDGLIIIDGDDTELKRLAIPYFRNELVHKSSFNAVGKTLENWNDGFKIQVNPREINLFYLTDDGRYRIIERDDRFYLDGNETEFSKEEILNELDQHPERFSPNVIMRPLYQEIILPNLCYIGGGGEIAYWLQLKNYFDSEDIPFPILLLRNSALLVTDKQLEKLDALELKVTDLFKVDHELNEQIIKQVSEIEIDFKSQKEFLKKQFDHLYEIAQDTDPSFLGAVGAQERKQIKGLENLEKRLLKAQKRKWNDHLERVAQLKNELFPNDSLQERQANFSFFYKDLGPELLQILKDSLNPLDPRFTVIEL
ncbi:bacillithiol biosynthesis cysteine-adding enzyme BshC [Nonlabens sp. Hel1_33_55]|uniref:bacillithiol biosynthesis cysteine-adding enzyme BshC n=1 Tax=Nonlabens sp. Hel1_33_55 TaxID=1336802 RepID=UPI000875B06B|nr:bacillithiol biosynthesis cysteine-adding enzyme BshC [Nonlabens sp. Hel1_33_55]SCY16254.1 bacillithiol biosynthesis cysteine-adding enzyme BshC [Nonlabens sp. Hel1_33_55]